MRQCENLSGPGDRIRELEGRIRAFTEFALAQEEWEATILTEEDPWFDLMPEESREGFEEVQRLRNKAMGLGGPVQAESGRPGTGQPASPA